MNFFTFTTKLLRTFLLAVVLAIGAIGLAGCGEDEDGDDLVGDWMVYSRRYMDGDVHYFNSSYSKAMLSFRSSGEASEWLFEKVGNVWVEVPFENRLVLRWRTDGRTIYLGDGNREEEWATYSISGNKLFVTICGYVADGRVNYCREITYTKVNVADIRKDLGRVYTNDSRLTTVHDDLIWYMQSNVDKYIEFGSTRMWGNGIERYVDYSDPYYYTNGNKLVLIDQDCDWDNDVRHCMVLSTDELSYSITGSGSGMRLTINGDVWLPAEYDYSPAKSKQPRRSRSLLSGLFIGR